MTGLDWQTLSVSLAQGIDTKSDPKQVQADYLLLQNAVFDTTGQLNLRSGFAAFSKNIYQGGTVASGNSLGALDDALLIYSGSSVYAQSETLSDWTTVGQKLAVASYIDSVGTNTSPLLFSPCVAKSSNGLELYVWTNDKTTSATGGITGNPYYSVYDPSTQSLLTSGYVGSSSTALFKSIRCEAVGANFFIIAVNSVNQLVIYKQSQTSPNFQGATATVVASSIANADFNIDTCTSPTRVYIANAGKVYAVVASSLAVTTSPGTAFGNPPSTCIAYDSINDVLWVAKADTSGGTLPPQASVLNPLTLALVAGPTTLTSVNTNGIDPSFGPVSANASSGFLYLVGPASQFAVSSFKVALSGSVISVLASSDIYANGLVSSKPRIRDDGFLYVVLSYSSSFTWPSSGGSFPNFAVNPSQPSNFLVRWDPSISTSSAANNNRSADVVSRSLALDSGLMFATKNTGTGQTFWACCDLIMPDNNTFIFAALKQTATVSVNGGLRGSSLTVRSSFRFGTKIRTRELGGSSHSTGGFISSYDGAVENENNFHLFPELEFAGYGTGSVPNGTYGYRAVFSWVNALGQVQRSAPSDPLSVTVSGGPQSVALSVSILNLTNKSTLLMEIYRTAAGGTTYFLLGQRELRFPDDYSSLGTGFVDTGNSLTTLALYTTGGEVENIAAPAMSFITQFKNRLVGILTENPLQLWYSKQIVPRVPVEFSDLFSINLDQKYGNATALAVLDDKLVIFKENGISFIVGDGPAPSGANNDFSYPQNIPCDSGVSEPDSVIEYPDGIFFKGSKGIYLLTRSLQAKYIGAPVQAFNQFTVVSSDIDPAHQVVRFGLSNGVTLAYNYFVEKWSVYTNTPTIASKISGNNYYYLKSDGAVEAETPGSYSDDGAIISLGLLSGWLSFAKIEGFQRIRLIEILGRAYSGCSIQITFAYDFDPTIVQTVSINSPTPEDPWQWQIYPSRQKCESMQIGITVTPTTVGRALSLSVIALEAGLKRGLNTLPASRSAS